MPQARIRIEINVNKLLYNFLINVIYISQSVETEQLDIYIIYLLTIINVRHKILI